MLEERRWGRSIRRRSGRKLSSIRRAYDCGGSAACYAPTGGVRRLRYSRSPVASLVLPCSLYVGDHVAGDGLEVHFVGAVDEAGGAGVAHHALERRVRRVAEGAVHLDGAVDDLPERVGDVVLGHRDFLAEGQLVLDLVGGVEHHELGGVELHRGLGDHPLDALLVGEHASRGRSA